MNASYCISLLDKISLLLLPALTFSHRMKFDWRFAEFVTVSFLRASRKSSGENCHIHSEFNYLDETQPPSIPFGSGGGSR